MVRILKDDPKRLKNFSQELDVINVAIFMPVLLLFVMTIYNIFNRHFHIFMIWSAIWTAVYIPAIIHRFSKKRKKVRDYFYKKEIEELKGMVKYDILITYLMGTLMLATFLLILLEFSLPVFGVGLLKRAQVS